jgi:hypothetical protein
MLNYGIGERVLSLDGGKSIIPESYINWRLYLEMTQSKIELTQGCILLGRPELKNVQFHSSRWNIHSNKQSHRGNIHANEPITSFTFSGSPSDASQQNVIISLSYAIRIYKLRTCSLLHTINLQDLKMG